MLLHIVTITLEYNKNLFKHSRNFQYHNLDVEFSSHDLQVMPTVKNCHLTLHGEKEIASGVLSRSQKNVKQNQNFSTNAEVEQISFTKRCKKLA